jgi:TetR/AcrR family transcriptional regulator, tetracycline repressor protein
VPRPIAARLAWPAEPPRSTRQPLSRERLVQAALHLLDEIGLDRLSMRRLAERLGVQSASLYWHVRDKDQLLTLLADALCADIPLPDAALPWRARLTAIAWEYRRVLLRHRDAALLLASTLPVGPNRLRLAEGMLGTLLAAGFGPATVARASLLFTDYVTNFVVEEGRAMAMTAEFATNPGDGPNSFAAWFAALPEDEYPNLAALAPQLTDTDADERFRFGVKLLLDGLAAQT